MCGVPVGGVGAGVGGDSSLRVVPEERKKKGSEELRELWRKAILQQILLLRMERENQRLQGEAAVWLNGWRTGGMLQRAHTFPNLTHGTSYNH